MPPSRRSSGAETRAAILAAARERFSTMGYEPTTLRAVAGDVGVDPAMVIRYFGSKDALFVEAADFQLGLPDLSHVAPERLADVLMPRFFAVWEDDTTFLALLRASVTSPTAAARMREVFATQVAPTLGAVAPDHPTQRAGVLGSLVLGTAMSRYVLRNPAMAAMSRQELTNWIAPLLSQTLTGRASHPDESTDSRPG